MEDREILELAAKAAGLHVDVRSTIPDWLWVRESKTHGPYRLWNPLTDDGDALRLAVQLRLEVSWWRNAVLVETDDKKASSKIVLFGGDAAAAIRRAITRAAASMATA